MEKYKTEIINKCLVFPKEIKKPEGEFVVTEFCGKIRIYSNMEQLHDNCRVLGENADETTKRAIMRCLLSNARTANARGRRVRLTDRELFDFSDTEITMYEKDGIIFAEPIPEDDYE